MNITKEGDDQIFSEKEMIWKLVNTNITIKQLNEIKNILKECEYFINQVPNKKYDTLTYKDSYELASELGKLIKQLER